ncbi:MULTISPECIES: hypothetical protein [unclassified Streptomyces]|uniref:hypothetical protein n=1 Tax=unclassified Streptomyces TaxID=2593676 RepID=UPI000DC77869|nr:MULTISPECIES: hypothetical protein [unclassified Streptomyces]AWZ06869.1 hypothetical protein DRB89_22140 [Streptomyces sp. ICC4]AWZ14552.1 hypothetical protein DRB96_22390 [Streptomyces sp. ICC1]
MTTPDTTTTADGPVLSTEAYAAVEKAAKNRRALYAPSVLEHAAELLTALWAAGEKHGVAPTEWAWTTDLAGGTLDVVTRQYESAPKPERTIAKVVSLHGHLVAALQELGLTARLGGPGILVERGPDTPRGGRDGDAEVEVRIHSDGGWNFSFAAQGAPVMSIVAPASEAGASQVAEIVRAFVRGELGPVFRH